MDAERLRRINALLEAALELPEGEREPWLQTLPPEQQLLVPLLKAMLARSGVETDTFLRQPLPVSVDDLEGLLQRPDEVGDEVGPWRLIRELGRGGMATVWLAKRSDGGLQRQVALKLPHVGWSPGLAQRMVRERDILAGLEHPCIARLYDAGTTPEGRPWLAMESVAGVTIDTYCRDHALGVEQRLRLFLQVAQAVAHAHARLVVHRDLKPNNILVTPEGSVRLLDFGVAKLLVDEAQPSVGLTQLLGFAVTPDYASPEQVGNRSITVATDVYSLGVVLYEMLTERRPYRLPRSGMAALEEAILAADAPLASARASGRLARQLRGDLDNVLAKALRKDVSRRYASVESMAADLLRHLDGEPVLAQPRGRLYRARKFVGRHRWPLAVAASVLLATTLGMAAALWQAREARHQESVAWQSLEVAEASFDFAQAALMEGVQAGESISLDTLLDRIVVIAEKSFNGNPTERLVAVDAAASWLMSVDRGAQAEDLLSRALGSLPAGFQSGFVGYLRCKRGHALVSLGRHDEGVRELEAGLADNQGREGSASYCLQRLAAAASQANDARAQLDHMLRAEAAFANERRRSPTTQAHLLADLGAAYALNGRIDEAQARFRSALDLLAQIKREESTLALSARNGWALSMLTAGDPQSALAQFELIIAADRRRSTDGSVSQHLLANQLLALNLLARHDEALAVAASLLRQSRASGNEPQQLRALSGRALALAHQGALANAQAALDEATLVVQRGKVPANGSAHMTYRMGQAVLWQLQGRLPEARDAFDALVQDLAAGGVKSAQTVYALFGRSEVLLAQGEARAAQADAEQALALAQQLQGGRPRSLSTGRAWLVLSRARQALGSPEAALEAAAKARDLLVASVGAGHPLSLDAARLARPPGP